MIAMGFVMLRRTRRGEKAFTDRDWRLLFGKGKADVLTGHYGGKLALAFLACGLLGLVEYVVLMPYGTAWLRSRHNTDNRCRCAFHPKSASLIPERGPTCHWCR